MELALFIASTGAAHVAPKLLELAHVKSVTIRRQFQRGELLGYTIQVRTEHDQYTLTEDMLDDLA